jgi:hypothetical protein
VQHSFLIPAQFVEKGFSPHSHQGRILFHQVVNRPIVFVVAGIYGGVRFPVSDVQESMDIVVVCFTNGIP